jgi:hypothetical protein
MNPVAVSVSAESGSPPARVSASCGAHRQDSVGLYGRGTFPLSQHCSFRLCRRRILPTESCNASRRNGQGWQRRICLCEAGLAARLERNPLSLAIVTLIQAATAPRRIMRRLAPMHAEGDLVRRLVFLARAIAGDGAPQSGAFQHAAFRRSLMRSRGLRGPEVSGRLRVQAGSRMAVLMSGAANRPVIGRIPMPSKCASSSQASTPDRRPKW